MRAASTIKATSIDSRRALRRVVPAGSCSLFIERHSRARSGRIEALLFAPCREDESEGRSHLTKAELGGRMRYKVVLHRNEEGISVSVPALPGCWSEGDTDEEALENIRDAIREYLAALDDQLQGAEVREVEVAG